MLEIKQLTRLQIIRYCEKLEKENKKLKSEIENMKKVGRENIETLDRMSIELENYSKSFKRYRDFSKQELADSLYDAEEQNKKLKERIGELEEENKTLKEDIEIKNKFECVDLEVASERIKQLEEQLDNKGKVNKSLRENYKKLEEERDFFKEQAILWRKDYKNEYEKNIKLEKEIEELNKMMLFETELEK